jgi:WD40 repeat protein
MDDLISQTVKGYELRERIGAGGLGVVYRAHQKQINREVAIKIIQPMYANHPDFIRRFEAEAQLIARLEHIHIIPLYDYWREPDRAYLVMRWLRGGSVRHTLAHGPWEVEAVAQLLDQMAAALQLAHQKGVIHRDIKPDNILLDDNGNAYLTDFGIAVEMLGDQDRRASIIGSPAYIPPETLLGEPATPQADIYSLGIVLYELLTGQPPFLGADIKEMLRRHIEAPIPHLQHMRPDLPNALNAVIWRATAKSPDARHPNASSLAADFRRAAQLSNTHAEIPAAVASTAPRDAVSTTVIDGAWEPVNPYKGLRAFEQADAADFFGRDALIRQLLDRLAEPCENRRFLAVVGPSGSGKSSAVKAGLIPALQTGDLPGADKWFIAEMVPGADPLHELESALLSVAVNPPADLHQILHESEFGIAKAIESILPPDEHTELLLVVDQFEEVFTQTGADAARTHLLDSIHAAVTAPESRLRVIITLRADFYDRPLLYEGFGALVRDRTEVVLPLTTAELEEAIAAPAKGAGLHVEPALVQAIVNDIGAQSGALPLLQYALTEVFERRQGQKLTQHAYHDSGGVLGALARRADAVYNALAPEARNLARALFLRLIVLGDSTGDMRRRVRWSELASLADDAQAIETVRDAFVQYRLLTLDCDPATREPTVEVAHEALIREWRRLLNWLNENRVGVRLQRILSAAAGEWQDASQDPSFLLSGTRLSQFEEWAETTDLQLTQTERLFLNASIAQREAQEANEAKRRAHEAALEQCARSRMRVLVLVMAVALVIASTLAYFAFKQRAIAENRMSDIESLALVDSAQHALDDGAPELALALALAANQKDDAPQAARQMLYRAAYAPGTRLVFNEHQAPVLSAVFSPDGTLVASSSGRLNPLEQAANHGIYIWDPVTGEVIHHLTEDAGGHHDTVLGIAFSPDGQMLASGSADNTIILWDVATGDVIRRLEGHQDWVNRVAFSPDGRLLFSSAGNFLNTIIPIPGMSTQDKSVRVWDLETGEEVRRFEGHEGPVTGLAISANGRRVVSSDAAGVVFVWDPATGEEIQRFESPGDWVNNVDISADGRTVLTALGKPSIGGSGSTSTLMVSWDVETGERLHNFEGHTNIVINVELSPDERTALTGSGDRNVCLWDMATGKNIRCFQGHTDWVFDVSYSPDGRWALSGSTDTTIRLWDLQDGAIAQRYDVGHTAGIHAVAFSPDERLALSGDNDGHLILWRVANGTEICHLNAAGGSEAASAINDTAFSPDGQYMLSGDSSSRVILWDSTTCEEIRRFEGHTDPILDVSFSPDGARIATASGALVNADRGDDNTARVWNVETGEEVRRFEGHADAVRAAVFSPDGSRLATGSGNSVISSGDNSVRVWDIETGEETRRFESHTDVVSTLAFSPDGAKLLSGSDDSTTRLWDIETGEEIRRFTGHISYLTTVLYNPDAQTFLSTSDDHTIRLWEIATGEELYRYEAHDSTIWKASLSSGGRALLSASDSAEIYLWRIDRNWDELQTWMNANRYTRDLTCPEREKYRLEPCLGD